MDLEYAVHVNMSTISHWLLIGEQTNGASERLSYIYGHIAMMILQFRGIFAFQTQLKDQDFIMKSRQICGRYTKQDLKWNTSIVVQSKLRKATNFSIDFNIKTSCQSLHEKRRTAAYHKGVLRATRSPERWKLGLNRGPHKQRTESLVVWFFLNLVFVFCV